MTLLKMGQIIIINQPDDDRIDSYYEYIDGDYSKTPEQKKRFALKEAEAIKEFLIEKLKDNKELIDNCMLVFKNAKIVTLDLIPTIDNSKYEEDILLEYYFFIYACIKDVNILKNSGLLHNEKMKRWILNH